MRTGDDYYSKVIDELCALFVRVLDFAPAKTETMSQVTPAALVSLLLGMSLSLMLCGSVTFVIGFILMPWVLGMVMVLSFVGLVSNLSGFGKAFLCPSTSPKEIPRQPLQSKLPII